VLYSCREFDPRCEHFFYFSIALPSFWPLEVADFCHPGTLDPVNTEQVTKTLRKAIVRVAQVRKNTKKKKRRKKQKNTFFAAKERKNDTPSSLPSAWQGNHFFPGEGIKRYDLVLFFCNPTAYHIRASIL